MVEIFIIALISLLWVTVVNSMHPLLITLAFLPFVIGQIIPCVILYPVALNFMPAAKGRVSAVIQGVRLILTALSLQMAGYFYDGSFRNIGLLMLIFIFMTVLALFLVVRHRALMKFFAD